MQLYIDSVKGEEVASVLSSGVESASVENGSCAGEQTDKHTPPLESLVPGTVARGAGEVEEDNGGNSVEQDCTDA